MEDEKVREMMESVRISKQSGYVFACLGKSENYKCKDCEERLVSFTTKDIKEAYSHSLKNMMPVWITYNRKL